MYRLLIVLCCVAALSVGGGETQADKPGDVAAFMRLKLSHSQKLLEGIALEDFAAMEKSAQDLSSLSRDEEWLIYTTPEYLRHSEEFRRAVDSVREAAAKKSVDGAALGYVGVTLSCVNCHKYVRNVRMAGLPSGDGPALAAK